MEALVDRERLRTFLLGGAMGALAGILLAPRTGRELRGSIANRAGEARERGRETYFETQERVQERIAEAREGSRREGAAREKDITVGAGAGEPAAPPSRRSYGPPGRTPLRDVSRDVHEDAGAEEPTSGERSEELRRKVRETRARLRERLEGSGERGSGERESGEEPDA
jgi:hypothetical protein